MKIVIKEKEYDTKHKIYEGSVKQFDDEKLVVEHFISTEMPDRSGDVVFADGIMFDGVPTVLKQHGFDSGTGNEPIAKPLGLSISTDDKGFKGMLAKTQYFDGRKLTPPDNTGQRLYLKAKEKFMPYWSIGYAIVDSSPNQHGGVDIKKCFVYEYSQVGVPDNIGCEVVKMFDHETLEKKANEIFTYKIESEAPLKLVPELSVNLKTFLSETEEKYILIVAEDQEKAKAQLAEKALFIGEFSEEVDRLSKLLGIEKEIVSTVLCNEHLSKMSIDKFFDALSIPTNLKTIADRVSKEIPWEAMRILWFGMLDELSSCDGSKKTVVKILNELMELLSPFALNFATACAAQQESRTIEIKEGHYTVAVLDQAKPPTDQKRELPEHLKSLYSLLKKDEPAPSNRPMVPFEELVKVIKDSVKSEMKSAVDKISGKV